MAENDIIMAFESDLGVTIHTLGVSEDDETTAVQVTLYRPDDEDFIWALEQARKLNNG